METLKGELRDLTRAYVALLNLELARHFDKED